MAVIKENFRKGDKNWEVLHHVLSLLMVDKQQCFELTGAYPLIASTKSLMKDGGAGTSIDCENCDNIEQQSIYFFVSDFIRILIVSRK